MKILILLTSLIGFHYANAQDSLQSHIENGRFYSIFPVVGDYVAYSDSIPLAGSLNKDSFYYKAISFFDKNEDAKYYFESEDMDAGELIYQGELHKSVISRKSDVHFTVVLHFTGDSCRFKLFEVVVASSKAQDIPIMVEGVGGQTHVSHVRGETIDRATQLENITIDKDEFSRRYCEKINKQFMHIMDGISEAFR